MAVSALIAVLTGCTDFLKEETNGKVFSNALQTEAGLDAALTGTYKQWNNGWSNGFLHTWQLENTMGGEDLATNHSTPNTLEFDTYNVTSSNSSIPNIYNSCYLSIKNANGVIEAAPNCNGSAEVIGQILGEAYFIRAFDYFVIARMHKAAPLMLSSVYNPDDMHIEPTGTEGLYAQIEADLEEAIRLLPVTRRNNELSRPNKGVAQALLAEVYLHEAGYPLKKQGYYAKAASMAKNVLDNHAAYGFDFESSYENLFLHTPDKGGITKESIFQMCSNKGNWCYGTAAGPSEVGGWNYIFSELNFFRNFPEGPRKDCTFMTEFDCNDGIHRTWQELDIPRPVYRKLAVNDAYSAGSWSIAICMLRYSQTALTYAEAQARSGSVNDLARTCLNTIRRRAGLEDITTTDPAQFAQACVNERMWEFAAEGVRWYDIQRLELLDEAIAQRDPSENKVIGSKGEECYFFPLPNTEQVLNPNLK
jgi:hypothetical protein